MKKTISIKIVHDDGYSTEYKADIEVKNSQDLVNKIKETISKMAVVKPMELE